MHRFFLPPEAFQGSRVSLEGRVAYQLREVLRLGKGQHILALDSSGWEYEVELTWVGREGGEGEVREKRPAPPEPRTQLHLYQAILKGDKFEFVLQKGTEIGITAFTPIFSLRCVVRDVSPQKQERWERVITEAAEQSGRGRLPQLLPPLPFPEACEQAQGLRLIPYEGEWGQGLHQALAGVGDGSIHLFIGPEGGFEPEEVDFSARLGVKPVSLGRRILRAETAALVAAAAILYHMGDMEP